MWSEDLDRKIQLAAENNDSTYNEAAWEKMESLLDQHLPRKKKRRRALLLLFTVLLTGSAAFFLLRQTRQPATVTTTESSQQTPALTNQPVPGDQTNTGHPTTQQNDPATGSIPANSTPVVVNKTGKELPTDPALQGPAKVFNSQVKNTVAVETKKDTRNPQKNQFFTTREAGTQAPVSLPGIITGEEDDPVKDYSATAKPTRVLAPALPAIIIHNLQTAAMPPIIAGNASVIPAAMSSVTGKPAGRTNKLTLTASFGPDISSVGTANTGRVKMQFGMGLSYALNEKLSIRAGFYASRKIYTADSADYHPPQTFWNYYTNLQKIDANCMVYEIPVTLVYNFRGSARANWFASAGLSSYLMKKETYGYSYKDAGGQPRYFTRNIQNENNHFFSIIHLSGGYQYRFSDRFSLMAEPYLKLPVSGVGFGKVNLNSGGILFTVGLRPFAGRK